MSNTIVLNTYVVRFSNGSIDHSATLAKFEGDLFSFAQEREKEESVIAEALHGIFDSHKGKRIPMPFLTSEVLRVLNVQPENFKSLTEKVQEYVRACDDFSIGKGKGGGVGRACDLPAKG
jgi:hypothetical protein